MLDDADQRRPSMPLYYSHSEAKGSMSHCISPKGVQLKEAMTLGETRL